MKKFKLILASLVFLAMAGVALDAYAVPAYPGPIKAIQADGSEITVLNHGDEFFNYTTTLDGYLVESKNGGFYYAEVRGNDIVVSDVMVRNAGARSAQDRAFLSRIVKGVPSSYATAQRNEASTRMYAPGEQNSDMFETQKAARNTGEKFKSLVILMNFPEQSFSSSSAQEDFTRLLNEPGYSDNGGTGSAWDYYHTNSSGVFDPEFVVVGPFTSQYPMDYGSRNMPMSNMQNIVKDIIEKATEAGVNWADYSDGTNVRDIFIFYAGNNAAETADKDATIWPHRGPIMNNYTIPFNHNGYSFYGYACTSEFRGQGSTMAGIGTFSHEFGHVLGLADLYDTNSDTEGTVSNGTPMCFGIMDAGSYNDSGRTPPPFNSFERYQQGWLAPRRINTGGTYELSPLVSGNDALMIRTENDGEFYLIDYHLASDNIYDQRLSSENPAYQGSNGLSLGRPLNDIIVYHVDSSNNMINGTAAKQRWMVGQVGGNTPNAASSHLCFQVVQASYGDNAHEGNWVYPGGDNITNLTPLTNSTFLPWGYPQVPNPGRYINSIQPSGTGTMILQVEMPAGAAMNGTVKSSSGTALPQTTVILSMGDTSKAPAQYTSGKGYVEGELPGNVYFAPGITQYYFVTDADGKFKNEPETLLIPGTYSIKALKEGYEIYTNSQRLSLGNNTISITLKEAAAATGVSFGKPTLSTVVGEDEVIPYTFSPAGASAPLTWTSSDPATVEVLDGGILKPLKAGTATITASSTAFAAKPTCTVTVTEEISGLTVTYTDGTTASVSWTPVTGVLRESWVVTWGNKYDFEGNWDAPTLETKTTSAEITNLIPGQEYTVTVNGKRLNGGNWGGVSDTFTTTAGIAPTAITLDKTTLDMYSRETATLTATVAPEDAYSKDVFWSSSDEAIATVDQTGKVTALSGGKVTITARVKYGDLKATCVIAITQLVSEIAVVAVNENDAEITWSSDVAGTTFTVDVFEGSSTTPARTIDAGTNMSAYLSLLKPATFYKLVLSSDSNGKKSSVEATIQTEAVANNYASMKGIKGVYTAQEEIVLSLIGVKNLAEEPVWTVGGQAVNAPRIKLAGGTYLVKVTYKAGSDTEMVMKSVTVTAQ